MPSGKKHTLGCGDLWSVPPWAASADPRGTAVEQREKREKRGGSVHFWPFVLTSVGYHITEESDGHFWNFS